MESSNSITQNYDLNPWWVTGITDSEGNFSINYNKVANKISASYKVTQNEHSMDMLYKLKNYFGVGSICIDNRKENAYKFVISNSDLLVKKVIPHFDKYPLVGSKNLYFLAFKKAVELFENKGRTVNKDLIISIKNAMNKKRSFSDRWEYLNKKIVTVNAHWVQAFIDGEGSFQFTIVNTVNRNKPYLSTNPTLEVAQHSHEVKVLDAIRIFFGVGYLKPNYDINSLTDVKSSRTVTRLIISQAKVVIDFVDKYPMFTIKHLDYLDWKKLAELKCKNLHKTEAGLSDMKLIKSHMNRGRLLNSSLLTSSD